MEMIAVEGSWRDVVEGVVIDARQPVGAIRIGPDPRLKSRLNLGELFLGSLRLHRVQHPTLGFAIPNCVEDLRYRRVQGVR